MLTCTAPHRTAPHYNGACFHFQANIWVGTGGTCTPLHYDNAHNLLLQAVGSKRVWTFPPNASADLILCVLRELRIALRVLCVLCWYCAAVLYSCALLESGVGSSLPF